MKQLIFLLFSIVLLTGCGTLNSPFLSQEEKIKIAFHEFNDNKYWERNGQNMEFLFKDKNNAEFINYLAKEKGDFKTLDFYAYQTLYRWQDPTLLNYLVQQLEQGKMKINTKGSQCRHYINNHSSFRPSFFNKKPYAERQKELRVFLRFAKLTDPHFFKSSNLSEFMCF